MLTGRDYFEAELAKALEKKFPDEKDAIANALEQVKADGYLNDTRALENFVSYKLKGGYGPYYIREKLLQKGVSAQLNEITGIIEALELDMPAIMRGLAEKYRLSCDKGGRAFMESCIRYLSGRGFALGESIKICKEVAKDESDFS